MSAIASCTKETAPPEEKTEEKTDIPEKQELQAPNEELILISAAEKAELLYFEKDGAGYVFHLAEEITVEEPAFQGDVISIENKYVYKVGDQYDKTMILFNDGVFVSFNKASDIRLSLKPKTHLYGYAGKQTQLDFTFQKGSYKLDAAVTSVPGCDATVTIDNETLSGTVTMTITEPMGKNSYQSVLTITDGTESKEFIINLEAYYLYFRGTNLMLYTEDGGSMDLKKVLDTNIPFEQLDINFSETWIDIEEVAYNQWAFVAAPDGNVNHFCDITVGVTDNAITPVTLRAIQKDGNDYVSYHVEDNAFLNRITELADSDRNGLVTLEEAAAITELDIQGCGIRSVTGIEYFKEVRKLYAADNDIVDASMFRELHYLYWVDLARNEHIGTVDVSGCSWYFEYFDAEPVETLDLVCFAGQNVLTMGYYDIIDNLPNYEDRNKGGDYADKDGNMARQYQIQKFSRNVRDDRTSDIDEPYTVCKMIRRHTRGTGNLPVFITIRTVLQQDVDDGTVDRYLNKMYECVFNRIDYQYEKNYELFDFITVYEVQKDRYSDVKLFLRRCHDLYQELYREGEGYTPEDYIWKINPSGTDPNTEAPIRCDDEVQAGENWHIYYPIHYDYIGFATNLKCPCGRFLVSDVIDCLVRKQTNVIWDFGCSGNWTTNNSEEHSIYYSLDNICGIKLKAYAIFNGLPNAVNDTQELPDARWIQDARQLKIDYPAVLESYNKAPKELVEDDLSDTGIYAGWHSWE